VTDGSESMTRNSRGSLELGSGVIELLIPHRRPFLMVDAVASLRLQDPPRIEAHRFITMNEPWFAGHFPGMPLWPGALTMEGLGQSGVLLLVLTQLCTDVVERGGEAEDILEALRNLDRGYRLHPGYRPEPMPEFLSSLRSGGTEMAVGAAVDLKFLAPVLPGCRLDYVVELTGHFGDRVRFSVEAFVASTPVARGSITGALVARPPLPRPG
jgi:3-hydroxyacyl-[acyl-carrier-protein] dehydratase